MARCCECGKTILFKRRRSRWMLCGTCIKNLARILGVLDAS